MISSSETSSSPGSLSVMDWKSFGIGNKRIRRPRAIYFDAAQPLPPFHKFTQNFFPLPAAAARHQKRGLPHQAGLCATDLAAGRSIGCNFLQRSGKFREFRIAAVGPLLDLRSFLLQILLA